MGAQNTKIMNTRTMDTLDILWKNLLDKHTASDWLSLMNSKINYPMNQYYTEHGLVLEFAMVNTDMKDIEITVDKSVLTVKKSATPQPKDIKYSVRTIVQRELNMSFHLDTDLNHKYDTDNIKATLEKGLLSITVPYMKQVKTENKPKTIDIKVN